MKINRSPIGPTATTYEGGPAEARQTALVELERAVSTCLLWERTFYEKGSDIAARIADLCGQVALADVAALAVKARTDLKLRHVPLFLTVQLARRNSATKAHDGIVARTIAAVIQRPDEIGEFLSLYWKDGRQPLSAQVKKGLRLAFPKFSRYALAKWNRDAAVKLRDGLFLSHAKPKDDAQAEDWKALVAGTLESADTWEVALSAGADKKATWERLLAEKKLGYMALLMNLRNMAEAKVDSTLVRVALVEGAEKSRALPFRFLSAAKAAPMFADVLSVAMTAAVTDRLAGRTVVLVDVSGSMDETISAKSQLSRWEAAGALAVLLREMTPECRVFTFSNSLVEVMNVRGVALVGSIGQSQAHGGTHLAAALERLAGLTPECERVVVITDEQTNDGICAPWASHAYLLNVAPYMPGLSTAGGWVRVNGWSEAVVRWMAYHEGIALGASEDD